MHPIPVPAEHPGRALPPRLLAELREQPSLAVASIAGRDAVAAAVAALRDRGFGAILPTIALTHTEYGDFASPVHAVEVLRERLGPGVTVFDPVWLSSPALWNALNARFATVLSARFATWSPCSACHMYVHLCRLPLSLMLGSVPVITGEREAHGGRVKLSQTPESIDGEVAVFAHAGVELLAAIRSVDDEATIAELAGPRWEQGGRQLACILSGNYLDEAGRPIYDHDEQLRYVREFLLPAGMAVVDAWREDPEPDYAALVARVLASDGS